MALSNKFGHLLLTTGNKSEVAVGYSTIYGDMAGGFNPIKDLYKTRVFDICGWRNRNHRNWMLGPNSVVIDRGIIDKPPTAELRHDQKDEDSLPPYSILDGILAMLIDQDAGVSDCVDAGYDRVMVKKVENLLYKLILISTNNLKLYLDFLKTQFNHTQYSGFKLKLII